MKFSKILILYLLSNILSVSSYGQTYGVDSIDFDQTQILIKSLSYKLEIARSNAQRRTGLMYRTALGPKQGMIFVYPRLGLHRIWMKNTLIPLTVVWIDDSEQIIGIKQLQPCRSDPCASYGVSKPSRYIIELSAEEHDISVGDKLTEIKRVR